MRRTWAINCVLITRRISDHGYLCLLWSLLCGFIGGVCVAVGGGDDVADVINATIITKMFKSLSSSSL